MRTIFCIDITQELDSDCLLVNCDEWSINKYTKINYSWTKVGPNKEIKNSEFRGSLSIIMALFSNGYWLAMISNKTANTQIFINFLKKTDWVVIMTILILKLKIIILDNCPYHKSKEAIECFKTLRHKVYFLPPYSPSLSPIKLMFGWIKKMKEEKKEINWSKD